MGSPPCHSVCSQDFDGKRDRWNGYDPAAHAEVVEEFEKVEQVKKDLKREKIEQGTLGNFEEDDGAPSSDEDEDKYVDSMNMVGTKVSAEINNRVRFYLIMSMLTRHQTFTQSIIYLRTYISKTLRVGIFFY